MFTPDILRQLQNVFILGMTLSIMDASFTFQGHLKEGYGKLISGYCKLIVQKLKFHDKVRFYIFVLFFCFFTIWSYEIFVDEI